MATGSGRVTLTIDGRTFDAELIDVKITPPSVEFPELNLLGLRAEWTVPIAQITCQRCGRPFPLADALKAARHLCVPMNQSSKS